MSIHFDCDWSRIALTIFVGIDFESQEIVFAFGPYFLTIRVLKNL